MSSDDKWIFIIKVLSTVEFKTKCLKEAGSNAVRVI
jgi:hypothetical protein